MLYLMHFNFAEVELKSNKDLDFKRLKLIKDHTILINIDIKTHLGLIIRNMHCAQVVPPINYNFIIRKTWVICQ